MSKENSVEWLIEQFYANEGMITTKQLEQAKEMHKEEIINAWRKGDGVYDKVSKQMSVQYYNETYGGDNE